MFPAFTMLSFAFNRFSAIQSSKNVPMPGTCVGTNLCMDKSLSVLGGAAGGGLLALLCGCFNVTDLSFYVMVDGLMMVWWLDRLRLGFVMFRYFFWLKKYTKICDTKDCPRICTTLPLTCKDFTKVCLKYNSIPISQISSTYIYVFYDFTNLLAPYL